MAPLRYAAKFDPFLTLDCARMGRGQISPSGNTDPRSPVEAAAAAADLPFDIDEDELVIDEEGGGGDVDVEHATNELFSPVIVSTCSLNKKEDERRSSPEDERPRLQSEEPSKVRWFLSFVGLQRNYTPVELVQVRHFEFDSIEYCTCVLSTA